MRPGDTMMDAMRYGIAVILERGPRPCPPADSTKKILVGRVLRIHVQSASD